MEEKTFKSVKITIDTNPIVGSSLIYGADYLPHVVQTLALHSKFSDKFMLQMLAVTSRPVIGTLEVSLSIIPPARNQSASLLSRPTIPR